MENSKKIQALDDELLENVGGGAGFFERLFGGWEENVEIAPPTATPEKRLCPLSQDGRHKYGLPDAFGVSRCIFCQKEKD